MTSSRCWTNTASFTIAADKADALRKGLNRDIADLLQEDESLFDIDYEYDAEIETGDIDLDLAEAVTWLEPCGRDNELPVFAVRNAEVTGWRYLRGENRMAKFSIATEGENSVECLLFHDAAEVYDSIASQSGGAGRGETFRADVLGTVEINRWRDSTNVQMIAKYVLPAGTLK